MTTKKKVICIKGEIRIPASGKEPRQGAEYTIKWIDSRHIELNEIPGTFLLERFRFID